VFTYSRVPVYVRGGHPKKLRNIFHPKEPAPGGVCKLQVILMPTKSEKLRRGNSGPSGGKSGEGEINGLNGLLFRVPNQVCLGGV